MEKITFIIPCYNQAKWLTDAVISCIEQTIKPHEIIIVNDGSPDSTSQVAKSIIQLYADYNIILIEKENGGLSSARNAGLKIATGDYICCLDSDDKLHPQFIERCLEIDDDIVGVGQQEFEDSKGNWSPPHKHPKLENLLRYNCINCSSLFKRKVYDTIGGYDENMRLGLEDWDFWIRATQSGFTVTCTPELLFYYRKHGKSLIDVATENKKQIREYMATKY